MKYVKKFVINRLKSDMAEKKYNVQIRRLKKEVTYKEKVSLFEKILSAILQVTT